MPRRPTIAFSLAPLGLLVALLGCEQMTVEAPPMNPVVKRSVMTIPVQTQTVERTSTQPATVHAFHEARSFAKVSGYVVKLNVDIGSKVKANDVLAVIESPEINAQRGREEAALMRLTAGVTQADAQVTIAKARLIAADATRQQAQADEQRADAQLTADEAEHQRIADLVKQRAVADRLLDEATNRLDAARAAKAAVTATTAAAAAQVDVAKAQQTAAEADLLAAKADVEVGKMRLAEVEAMLSYTELRSPFDGVVVARNVELGDLVRNSQNSSVTEPLFVVAQMHKVRVRVSVPERDAPLANIGDSASITLQALPGETFSGAIARLAGGLDQGTRTMLVEIDLPNDGGRLIPGMFGQATILLDTKADQVALPASAVRYDEKGRSYVYVVDGEGIIQVVDVATGMDDGLQIEITSGLTGRERVVGPLLYRLSAGQRVNVEG
ncbi:MAG: efflux RND transporter periplasmic adaptor subunit [Planctomycetaceae bacterium]|nr:efflux RND transporter periplasmic adaptor subunit [Planctomycetaceae bacterium]